VIEEVVGQALKDPPRQHRAGHQSAHADGAPARRYRFVL